MNIWWASRRIIQWFTKKSRRFLCLLLSSNDYTPALWRNQKGRIANWCHQALISKNERLKSAMLLFQEDSIELLASVHPSWSAPVVSVSRGFSSSTIMRGCNRALGGNYVNAVSRLEQTLQLYSTVNVHTTTSTSLSSRCGARMQFLMSLIAPCPIPGALNCQMLVGGRHT